jgi:hypothetical protein
VPEVQAPGAVTVFPQEAGMTFKPMTYLVSFTMFVLLFMALGGYFGYAKIADHFLVQAYLDALPINSHVQFGSQGNILRWEDAVSLPQGKSVRITASNRSGTIAILFPDGPSSSVQPTETSIPLAARERTEDLRIDRTSRYLYARVFATSEIKSKEATWLLKYDLQNRQLARRASVNPILLPAPLRP